MGIDTDGCEELHLMARSESGQIVLEPLYVHRRVRGNIAAAPVGKKQLSLRGVDRWECEGSNRILKTEWGTRKRRHQRLKLEWKCARDVILQPQIRQNRGDRSARVDSSVLA